MGLFEMLELLWVLVRRGVDQKYRGSFLGILWSLINPIMMIAVFTFVFAVVLRARWGSGEMSVADFSLVVFASLITFNLFAEVVGNAPTLIVSQPNLVKKVVFPLEILPLAALGMALFQTGVTSIVLIACQTLFGHGFQWTAMLLPILIVPLCLFTLGIAWFLAALGVYVRDVVQVVPSILTMLMFLSPIFYPASALPDWIRPVLAASPIAYSVETVRDAVIFGRAPDWASFLLALAGGLVVAALGYAFFQKTRKGFADVL
jgi:lipopolysaccharide transport system permease protein